MNDAWDQTPAENFAAKSLRAAFKRSCDGAENVRHEIERLTAEIADNERVRAECLSNAQQAFEGLQKLGVIGQDETMDAALVSVDRYGGKTTRHGGIEIVDAERPD